MHLVIICGSADLKTPTVEFTSSQLLLNLKWYIVPDLFGDYYFFTFVQQKLQLLHKRSNVKMINHSQHAKTWLLLLLSLFICFSLALQIVHKINDYIRK